MCGAGRCRHARLRCQRLHSRGTHLLFHQTALLGYPSLKLLAAATKTNRAQRGSIAPLELDTVDVSDTEEEEEHAGQKAHQGRRKAKKPRAQRLKGQPAAQDKSRKHTG